MSIYIIAFIILAAAIGGWLAYDTYKNKQEAKRTAERRAMRKAKQKDDARRREERRQKKQQSPLQGEAPVTKSEHTDSEWYSEEEQPEQQHSHEVIDDYLLPPVPVEQAARDIQLEEVRQETKVEDIIPLDLKALEQVQTSIIPAEEATQEVVITELEPTEIKETISEPLIEDVAAPIEETPEQQQSHRNKIKQEFDAITERVDPLLATDFNFDTTFNDTMFSDFLNDPSNEVKNSTFTSNTGGNRKTPTIMFVDDAKTFRIRMENIIKQGGRNVILAANGQEAFDTLTKGNKPIDLIISDVEMPMVDGYELFRKIQETGSFDKLPFVIVTASNDNAIRAKEIGVTEVLLKPFNEKDIDNLVRRLLPQFY